MILTLKHPQSLLPLEVDFRTLCPEHSEAYRDLRLNNALASEDRRFFVECGERTRNGSDWRDECTEKFDENGRGISVGIGAFLQGENDEPLIGSCLAERWNEDGLGKTVIYKRIFVREAYREARVGEVIEHLLDAWAITHGYTKTVFTIRADKERWVKRQIDIFGASIIRTVPVLYVNGETADTHYLQRSLSDSKAFDRLIDLRSPYEQAIAHLSSTLEYLNLDGNGADLQRTGVSEPSGHQRSYKQFTL